MHGYIGHHIEKELEIPDAIKQLCALFLSLWFDIKFEWDPDRGGLDNDTTINGTTVTFGPNRVGHFRMVLSANLISCRIYSKYEWEITLKDWNEKNWGDNRYFYIGFVNTPKEKSVTRYDKGFKEWQETREYQHSIIVNNYGGEDDTSIEAVVETNDGSYGYDEIATPKIKEGDRFKVVFDFETRDGTLYHNDKMICIVFKDIPDEFIPGVALYYCVINCSLFRGCV